MPWLVAGRVLQGLGGGGLVPLTLALAADLYRGPDRVIALGSVAALQEAGSVFGPLYGAALAAAASAIGGWRFVFWINVPLALICGAGLFLGRRTICTQNAEAGSEIDWLSAGLLGIGLGLLVLALYPDDPANRATGALFIPAGLLSLALLGLYAWRQMRRLEPLIPRPLLRSAPFIGSIVANLLIGGGAMVAPVDRSLPRRLGLHPCPPLSSGPRPPAAERPHDQGAGGSPRSPRVSRVPSGVPGDLRHRGGAVLACRRRDRGHASRLLPLLGHRQQVGVVVAKRIIGIAKAVHRPVDLFLELCSIPRTE